MSQKFFELIPSNTNFDFVNKSKWFYSVSILFILATFVSLATRGMNYGVDFKGGTQVHVRFKSTVTANQIREALGKVELSEAMVQGFGDAGSNEYLIRVLPEELNLEASKGEIQKRLDPLAAGQAAQVHVSEERAYAVFPGPTDPQKIKDALADLPRKDLVVDSVAPFGSPDNHEYVVQFSGAASKIVRGLDAAFGGESFEILQTEAVGAKVGGKLRAQALGAVLISILLILIYVWIRFDLEFAPGGVIALAHDGLVILGVFSIFQLQFDLSIIAAVLTIVGFSINDTIVIYDRIRENLGKHKGMSIERVINLSLNETLGRTIITSTTLFLASLALLFMGGPITFNFALAFVIGVIAGSYSTIFIASPVTIAFHHYLHRKKRKS